MTTVERAAAHEPLEDVHVRELVRLATPEELKARHPNRSQDHVEGARQAVRDILHGRDQRLLVVVGPCSIHDPEAAIEYAGRLREVRDALQDQLLIVMRTYFEKPRTTVGWKGLVYDPQLDGTEDIPTGLEVSRQLLVEINQMGLPCGIELLDPITPQYYADLISWGTIGARTVESQVHRQLASGLSMPVGFKNATTGHLDVAAHAMVSASRPHTFFGVDASGAVAMVRTNGNPDTHIVLRGGGGQTNYDTGSIDDAYAEMDKQGMARPVMIDCSHGNSSKDHRNQPGVVDAVLAQARAAREAGEPRRVLGLMLESHLNEGRQDWVAGQPLRYGVSITDACIGWDDTERVLHAMAESLS